MSRQQQKPDSESTASKLRLLEPLAASRNRTMEVVERIAGEIAGGGLVPGQRLPTEQALMISLGVSRTVIREAISALKAEGLVVTRQGSGAFVATDLSRQPFRLHNDSSPPLGDVLHILELRLAVEVEAATLAARRATPAQTRRICTAHERFVDAIECGRSAIDEDFAFHRSVAAATGNQQFLNFLVFLGRFIIPRQSVRFGTEEEDQARHRNYLDRLVGEHGAIVIGIASREPQEAAAAMRSHLNASSERYGALQQSLSSGMER
jgi:GntR family transcriptional repressor for pyruvate dehydrogenase complex